MTDREWHNLYAPPYNEMAPIPGLPRAKYAAIRPTTYGDLLNDPLCNVEHIDSDKHLVDVLSHRLLILRDRIVALENVIG